MNLKVGDGPKYFMFTPAKIRNGATYFGSHLSANDYYAKGEKVVGHWLGEGAAALELRGEVSPADFESLRVNRNPRTGSSLTPRTKSVREPSLKEAEASFESKHSRKGTPAEIANHRLTMKPVANRVCFFDLQCSAQKSVSIMAVLAGDYRLREAHEKASRFALAELERFATRQKNSLTKRQSEWTGNICAAAFTHDASRSLDPQLHTHFVIANATRAESGKWYALNEFDIIHALPYAGRVYQNEMARAVQEAGYSVRELRKNGRVEGFEIEGVSDALCERFAKRRAEIEHAIGQFEKERGREPSPKEISIITRETRTPDLPEISTNEVRSKQRNQLSAEEWEHLQELRARAEERCRSQQSIDTDKSYEKECLQMAVGHLFERSSVRHEHEVAAEALTHGLGTVDLVRLKQMMSEGASGLVRLVPNNKQLLLSECCTKHGLDLEKWSVEFINSSRNSCEPLCPDSRPSRRLSTEQRHAVTAILETRDRVFGFRGLAGTGKTTTLREATDALIKRGKTVHSLAPTTAAVQVLAKEDFTNPATVESFLQRAQHHTRPDLKGSVVICDETGLQSNRQGAALLRLAQIHDMRLILVGDVRQHVSVEAGDFLRVLETHSRLSRCELSEIRRQEPPAYRQAIRSMAAGDARGGLEALDKLGWISESHAHYIRAAAKDYLKATQHGADLNACLAVAPTWRENHALTAEIRRGLRTAGKLAPSGKEVEVHESLRWTVPQKASFRNYVRGQIITFMLKDAGWKPGTWTVVEKVENGKVLLRGPCGSGDDLKALDLRQARSFEVAHARRIDAVAGDKILIRANDKTLGLINGQVLSIRSIGPGGEISTVEGVQIPATFRQWCHGYVVTSHKSQGSTCSHVVVAAEKLDAKSAYVACSRGRRRCSLHTPDKYRLMENLPEGSRRAALDVLQEMPLTSTPSVIARIQAWTVRKIQQARHFASANIRQIISKRSEDARCIALRWQLVRNRIAASTVSIQSPQAALRPSISVRP